MSDTEPETGEVQAPVNSVEPAPSPCGICDHPIQRTERKRRTLTGDAHVSCVEAGERVSRWKNAKLSW